MRVGLLAAAMTLNAALCACTEDEILSFRDCEICPEMVIVGPGEFMMGGPTSDPDSRDDERPLHKVNIAYQFAVGKYEVTYEQFFACVKAGGCGHEPSRLREHHVKENVPVVHVSWHDAREYVAWLSGRTGKQYRLLSEAEWEFAARAGTDTSYWWGESVGIGNAACLDCDGIAAQGVLRPVGSYKANAYGVHDTAGNVAEWIEDCAHLDYIAAPSGGMPWVETGDCDRRGTRGGASALPKDLARSSARVWGRAFDSKNGKAPYHKRTSYLGLRVARNISE